MTDFAPAPAAPAVAAGHHRTAPALRRLRRRYAAERRFKLYGIAAITLALAALAALLGTVVARGYTAFVETRIELTVHVDPAEIDPAGTRDPATLGLANYQALINRALYDLFPEITGRSERQRLRAVVSQGAGYELRRRVLADPSLIGQTITMDVLASSDIDQLHKGNIDRTVD